MLASRWRRRLAERDDVDDDLECDDNYLERDDDHVGDVDELDLVERRRREFDQSVRIVEGIAFSGRHQQRVIAERRSDRLAEEQDQDLGLRTQLASRSALLTGRLLLGLD